MNLNKWTKEQDNLWQCTRHYTPETTLTDYLYREECGKGLTSIEDCFDASIQRLEDYIQKHDGGLITAIRNDTDNKIDNRMTLTRKKWEGKQLDGRFKRQINNISHDKTLTWLRKGNRERNRISPKTNTKQGCKNKPYQGENREDATK